MKLFKTLLQQHNDEASDFHFKLFEPFVIGRDLKAKDDIVYLNFSSIWHLLNFLRNIAAGWLMEIFGDATYKVCRRAVGIYSIGVNSIPHEFNPVCFAVIPDSESKEVIQGTWRAAEAAAIMLIKEYKICAEEDCEVCARVRELMAMPLVRHYMTKQVFMEDKMEVIVALSDCSLGWTSFSLEEFGMEANMCTNHTTGIPASNYSQLKYYKSREIYDAVYDYMVSMSKIVLFKLDPVNALTVTEVSELLANGVADYARLIVAANFAH